MKKKIGTFHGKLIDEMDIEELKRVIQFLLLENEVYRERAEYLEDKILTNTTNGREE